MITSKYKIKIFTFINIFLCISCKPLDSSSDKKRRSTTKQSGNENSKPPEQFNGSKEVYSRDTCSGGNDSPGTSSVEIDPVASTVSMISNVCDTSSRASMGIGEVSRMYRITNTTNNTTSASYYQSVIGYYSENGKAKILQYFPGGNVDTQKQTVTGYEEAEEYIFNIRIEKMNDSTINLKFIDGQEILEDPVLGGLFYR